MPSRDSAKCRGTPTDKRNTFSSLSHHREPIILKTEIQSRVLSFLYLGGALACQIMKRFRMLSCLDLREALVLNIEIWSRGAFVLGS